MLHSKEFLVSKIIKWHVASTAFHYKSQWHSLQVMNKGMNKLEFKGPVALSPFAAAPTVF